MKICFGLQPMPEVKLLSFKKQQLLKHEELSRVSLSWIACETLVSYDDANIYQSDKNPDIS